MSEHIRSFLSASLLMGTSACATIPDRSDAYYAAVTERRAAIAGYTRSLAILDVLDIGECQTIDSVPVIYEGVGEDTEPAPQRGLTLREKFQSVGLSEVEARAAYAHYRYVCGLIEGELSRTRIQIPEDLDSEPE